MKYEYSNNLILTDCDGVLMNWEYAFITWMTRKGFEQINSTDYDVAKRFGMEKEESRKYVRMFNESAAIGFLPPLRDAIHYVRKLHEEHGYIFRVITSLSLNKHAGRLRQKNLFKLFGTAIDDVLCLDTGADKDEALAPYKDSGMIWIEDKPENAVVGYNLGLESIVIEHGHNMDFAHPDIPVVKGWKEIYEICTIMQN